MKVWPIDPLDPRNLRLEVPEKLPQGLTRNWDNQNPINSPRLWFLPESSPTVIQMCWSRLRKTWSSCRATHLDAGNSR